MKKTEVNPYENMPSGRRFPKGVSGNPDGRPKRTQVEKDALEKIRSLAPKAVETLRVLLVSPHTHPAVKVRICELILERTYGKQEASIKLTSIRDTVEESQQYIQALVARITEKS